MIASLEGSTGEERPTRRIRRDSTGNIHPSAAFIGNGNAARPLPQAPSLVYAHTDTPIGNGPMLLPRSSTASSGYVSALGSPHVTGNGNGNGTNITPQTTGPPGGIHTQRPLPAPPNDGYVPFPLSHRPSHHHPLPPPPSFPTSGISGKASVRAVSTSSTAGDESSYMTADEGGDGVGEGVVGKVEKNMMMQDLLQMLEDDTNAGDAMKNGMGTVKHFIPASVPGKHGVAAGPGNAAAVPGQGKRGESEEEELTMEELLALSPEPSLGRHVGAEAWELNLGPGETVKRVSLPENSGRIGSSLKMERKTGMGDLFFGGGGELDVLEPEPQPIVVKEAEEQEQGELDVLAEQAKELERERERERVRLLALEKEREVARLEAIERDRVERERLHQLAVAQREEAEREERERKYEERERELLRIVAECETENVQLLEELENDKVGREEREEQEQMWKRFEGEVEVTRRMVEVLRGRIGEVEKRVSEIEEREEDRKKEEEEHRRDATGSVIRNLKMLALVWSNFIPAFISSSSSSSSSSSTSTTSPSLSTSTTRPPPTGTDTDTETRIRTTGNKNTQSGNNKMTRRQVERLYDSFPSYLLVIGIGACAFILRGLVRRMFRGVGMGMGRR
jgi:hypothetical protein